jgi:hypothetical protein
LASIGIPLAKTTMTLKPVRPMLVACQVADSGANGDQFLLKHPLSDVRIERRDHAKIVRLRPRGWTLRRIAERFRLTRQLIHQILKRCSDKSAQQRSAAVVESDLGEVDLACRRQLQLGPESSDTPTASVPPGPSRSFAGCMRSVVSSLPHRIRVFHHVVITRFAASNVSCMSSSV